MGICSCKNGKPAKKQAKQATDEMFEEFKTKLADSVLVKVDALAEEYIANIESGQLDIYNLLTDKEKKVRPKYLFDPKDAEKLITRQQKVAALAFVIVERPVRMAYGMSTDWTDKEIVKLGSDTGYPLALDDVAGLGLGDRIRKGYNDCKEKNMMSSFWEIQYDAMCDVAYLLTSNPDLYKDRITEEQFQAHKAVWNYMLQAIEHLAKFDKEMERVYNMYKNGGHVSSQKEFEGMTKDQFFESIAANNKKEISCRNNLLK